MEERHVAAAAGRPGEVDLLQAGGEEPFGLGVDVDAGVAEVVETRPAPLEEAGGARRGAGLGHQHLDLRLALADLEEVVVRLLGREVGAGRPLRPGLVELEAEGVAQDLLGLLDGERHDADVVDVHEAH